ncbi:glycosyltransferase [Microbacterium sp. PI-1]|uniref:glycosyltransferase n=1 Tax=unclassified Microbacterium TaxID=2609290 RepID=UPI00103D5C4A|nr:MULTISPECIES: glycosyltransferase [unclassified Microbacterium]QEA29093.1 glycosyltransferase family 4 protein [Microbacterium sp. CBA3102]TCJ27984.1 glycosyltransferase [Microbacterium sp. PI-1]
MDSLIGRRIALVSRIFTPEPGAASLRLRALARRLHDGGANVAVFTSTPPRGTPSAEPSEHYSVSRAPVLRDRAGYVRGYLQYLSFDVPAFFRVLFARRFDALIVEPPPTTGVMMRVAAWARRTPYHFYAADVWSEAAAVAGAPAFVVRVVRSFERFAYVGARSVLAVSESVAERVLAVCETATVTVVGNGFDTDVFRPDGTMIVSERPYLLYAGTASEVHGAIIFIQALPLVLSEVPDARIVFIGQGSERDAISEAAEALAPGAVEFMSRMSAEETAMWIRGARATLASMLPHGYDAFPTKMYASAGCGVPVVYAGDNADQEFFDQPGSGWTADYEPAAVANAMLEALRHERDEQETRQRAEWAEANWSLRAVADRIVDRLNPEAKPHPSRERDATE